MLAGAASLVAATGYAVLADHPSWVPGLVVVALVAAAATVVGAVALTGGYHSTRLSRLADRVESTAVVLVLPLGDGGGRGHRGPAPAHVGLSRPVTPTPAAWRPRRPRTSVSSSSRVRWSTSWASSRSVRAPRARRPRCRPPLPTPGRRLRRRAWARRSARCAPRPRPPVPPLGPAPACPPPATTDERPAAVEAPAAGGTTGHPAGRGRHHRTRQRGPRPRHPASRPGPSAPRRRHRRASRPSRRRHRRRRPTCGHRHRARSSREPATRRPATGRGGAVHRAVEHRRRRVRPAATGWAPGSGSVSGRRCRRCRRHPAGRRHR